LSRCTSSLSASTTSSVVEARRIKWQEYGLEREAKALFSDLRKRWGSVSAGFNVMLQLKGDNRYERAEYGSFSEKDITAHVLKTRISKQDWLQALEQSCLESGISTEAAQQIFNVLDTHGLKEITHSQLTAGYKVRPALLPLYELICP